MKKIERMKQGPAKIVPDNNGSKTILKDKGIAFRSNAQKIGTCTNIQYSIWLCNCLQRMFPEAEAGFTLLTSSHKKKKIDTHVIDSCQLTC